MKILVFKIGAMGDILMTTPFLRQLKRENPDSKIDYIVGKSFKNIIKENKNIENIIPINEKIFLNKKVVPLIKLILKIRRQKYDKVYILDKSGLYSVFMFLTRIPIRVGFYRDYLSKLFLTSYTEYRNVRHEVYYYLDLLEKANYNDKSMELSIEKRDVETAKNYLKKLNIKEFSVFINSGGDNSGEKSNIRRIPEKKFKSILNEIEGKIILVGGPNDRKFYSKFSTQKIINAAGKLKINESCALMKMAKRIYSTDSGGMHLASIFNKNMTCYFGPTNPDRKAPLIDGIKIIWENKNKYDENYDLYGIIK